MRVGARIFGAFAVLLATIDPHAGSAQRPDPADDIQFIVTEAQRVQQSDVAAWRRYRFERLAGREDYDQSGRVVERDDLEFLITPENEGFHELLLRHNGAKASPSEQEDQQRAGTFNKHYRALLAGDEEEGKGGYSVGQLLHLASYRFAGRETIHGVECFRLDFAPGDVQPLGGGLAARFTRAMQGSLWITVEGFHLAAARAETVRPITIVLALSKVYTVSVSLETAPVGDGVWLPSRVEVETHARFVIRTIRRKTYFTYSGYSRVPSSS